MNSQFKSEQIQQPRRGTADRRHKTALTVRARMLWTTFGFKNVRFLKVKKNILALSLDLWGVVRILSLTVGNSPARSVNALHSFLRPLSLWTPSLDSLVHRTSH